MKVVYCHILSWVGSFVYAEHYYAKLRCGDVGKELTHKLTASEADRLNRRDADEFTHWEEGETAGQFFSEDRIHREATRRYKDMFPGAEMLVEGEKAVYDPQPIIDGPDKIKKAINDLVKQCDVVGWWDGDREAMQEIADEWEELWETLEVQD